MIFFIINRFMLPCMGVVFFPTAIMLLRPCHRVLNSVQYSEDVLGTRDVALLHS
jgi:hypothetical protein